MPVSPTDKDEKVVYPIMRTIVGLVAAAYVLYAVVLKQPCDIDRQYLSCRITGSVADWIGSIMFVGACLSLSGVLNWVYKVKSGVAAVLIGAAGALGAIIAWSL